MEKITVETTGNFMLVDPASGCEIGANEPATVPHTHFIGERLDNGDLREVGVKAKADPLDHDHDGRKGGSKPKAKASDA